MGEDKPCPRGMYEVYKGHQLGPDSTGSDPESHDCETPLHHEGSYACVPQELQSLEHGNGMSYNLSPFRRLWVCSVIMFQVHGC